MIFLSTAHTYVSKIGSCACLRALYVPWLLRCVRVRLRSACVTVPNFQNSFLSALPQISNFIFLRNPHFFQIIKILILPKFSKSTVCRPNPRFFFGYQDQNSKNANFNSKIPDRSLNSQKYPSFKIRMYTGESGTLRKVPLL